MKKLSIILPLLFCLSVLNSQTMAVLEFEGKGISQVEASALTDRLNNEIYKLGKYTLVERNQIEEILQEQGFQQSGCTSAECVVEVGRLLGAQKMVVGSISRVGDVFSVSARIVDMQSGEIEKFVNLDHEGKIGDLLKWGMEQIALDLITGRKIQALSQGPISYGSLYITTDRPNAKIWIDDEPVVQTTPLTIDKLIEGEHTIRAENNNYKDVLQIQIKPNEINTIHLKLKLLRNNLNVYSTPVGAEVYVKNVKKGITPITVKDLYVGKHSITIKKGGFATVTKEVNIFKEKRNDLNVTLQTEPVLTVSVNPKNSLLALFDLNKNRSISITQGIRVSLQPGNYRVEIRNDNYEHYVEEFTLVPEQKKSINAELIRKKGAIRIEGANIANCTISLGSKKTIMDLPATLNDIPTGPVNFVISQPDHISYETEIDVLWNNTTAVTVNMPSIISIENQIKSLSKKRNYWLIGSTVPFGLGGYFNYSANKNYDEYLNATSNAVDLRKKIEQEDQISPIFVVIGGICFIPPTIYSFKITLLKNLLNDGLIKE